MREVLEAALEPVDLRAPAVGAQHAAAPSA
jgi:hypothetical protein